MAIFHVTMTNASRVEMFLFMQLEFHLRTIKSKIHGNTNKAYVTAVKEVF